MLNICIDCKCEIKLDELVKFTPRCLKCRRIQSSLWRKKNKEHYAAYFRNYRKSEKGKQQYLKLINDKGYKQRRAGRVAERLKSDVSFKLCHSCRCAVYRIFKKRKLPKAGKTTKLIGTSNFDEIKIFIESQFKEGMTWENWGRGIGKWNIDHKIPLASATSKEEIIKLMHYTNLQPLWAVENSAKWSMYKGKRHIHFNL